MPTIENYQLLLTAAAACEDKKAEDVRILALDPNESGLADYFLICNGTNDRQNVAITDEVEIRLKRDYGVYPNSVEGRRQGEWILMDYVDFIVHVFSPEKRAFYGLERLRKTAKVIHVDDLNAELAAAIKALRAKAPRSKKISKETAEPEAPQNRKPQADAKLAPKPRKKAAAKSADKSSADSRGSANKSTKTKPAKKS